MMVLASGYEIWFGKGLSLLLALESLSPILCTTASGYLTHTSSHVELVSKTQNTFWKTVQPTHSKQLRLWPSGADLWDKLSGSKEELQATAQFIKNIQLQI